VKASVEAAADEPNAKTLLRVFVLLVTHVRFFLACQGISVQGVGREAYRSRPD
jgi:hypothetical protein